MTSTDTPASDDRPVRVPNVSAHAKSGLDHEVIGANAQAAYDANETLDAGGDPDALTVPAGDLDARIAWVSEPEDQQDRSDRADLIYAHEVDSDPDVDLQALGARLTTAVYGNAPTDPTNGALPTGTTAVTDPTGIAGTHAAGAATNALTGQVTAPGDPLPTSEQDGGTPLLPAVPDDLTTVNALLAWVNDGGDYRTERAQAVLAAETEKPEDDRRTTLVDPLTAIVGESQTGTATVVTTAQGEAVSLGSTD